MGDSLFKGFPKGEPKTYYSSFCSELNREHSIQGFKCVDIPYHFMDIAIITPYHIFSRSIHRWITAGQQSIYKIVHCLYHDAIFFLVNLYTRP